MSLQTITSFYPGFILLDNFSFFQNIFFFVILAICGFLNSQHKSFFRKQRTKLVSGLFIIAICSFLAGVVVKMFLIPEATTKVEILFFSLFTLKLGDALLFLALFTTLISWVYLSERYQHKSLFNVFYFFIFITATSNMVNADDFLTMFLFFEFIFLPSLFFVYRFGYAKKVDRTVEFLLLWTLTGSFVVLVGLCYLYAVHNTLNIQILSEVSFTATEKFSLFLVFFLGFGVKIPLWPFHYWLTKVHVEAPTGFSIFLSGFLVKTAFFCLATLSFLFISPVARQLALAVVCWGFVDASIRMWGATDIKRLIAFATIQEMNLIVFFLLMLSETNFRTLILFLVMHGVLSSLLFYLIDNVQKKFLTRNLVDAGGLSQYAPKLHFLIWCSLLIFRGFPLFVKFFIECNLLALLFDNFGLFGVVLFAATSIFGVIGFCRIWFMCLYGQPGLQPRSDMLKKDWILGLGLLATTCGLVFFIFV